VLLRTPRRTGACGPESRADARETHLNRGGSLKTRPWRDSPPFPSAVAEGDQNGDEESPRTSVSRSSGSGSSGSVGSGQGSIGFGKSGAGSVGGGSWGGGGTSGGPPGRPEKNRFETSRGTMVAIELPPFERRTDDPCAPTRKPTPSFHTHSGAKSVPEILPPKPFLLIEGGRASQGARRRIQHLHRKLHIVIQAPLGTRIATASKDDDRHERTQDPESGAPGGDLQHP